jgi:hypothetical protein
MNEDMIVKTRVAVCTLFVAVLLSVVPTTSGASEPQQLRVLHFPPNASLGLLYVAPPEFVVWRNEFMNFDVEPFRSVGRAQGTVSVPEKANLFLVLDYAAAENPSLLTALGPRFFTALKFQYVDTDDERLAKISELTGLRGMDLREADLTDAAMKSLAKMKSLELLNLSHTGVTDAGLPSLTALQSLKTLLLDATEVSDGGLKSVQQLRHLRILSLVHNKVTDKGLPSIATLAELESLELGEDRRITAAGLSQLTPLKNLKVLDVGNTAITAKDLGTIRSLLVKMPSIKCIQVIDTSFTRDAINQWQKALPGVTVIAMRRRSGNGLDIPESDLPKVFAPLHSWSGH